jgi:hypothetical protein
MPSKFLREGRWLTPDQLRKYNAEKNRKQIEEDGKQERVEGKEKVSVCVGNNGKNKKEKKDKKVVEVEMGKGNEIDEIFIEEETDAETPTLEEIKSKPKK